MPDKMKRLINCIIPVSACNFKCHYCYIGQTDGFKGTVETLPYSLEYIAYALRPGRVGEHCHIGICGAGETLLAPYLFDFLRLLTEQGHYCSIVTNGSLSKRFDELYNLPVELRSHVFIKFSYHYLELKRKNLLSVFWENVQKARSAGFAFTVELTVNDESIPYISELQEDCLKNVGANCHVIESRDNTTSEFTRLTKLPYLDHVQAWSQFESPIFPLQQETWGQKRHEFCYAGDWSANFYLGTGDVYTCFADGQKMGNLYENPDLPFPFIAVGENCPWAHCFAAHVLLTSGIIPHFPAPTYAQVRDRTYTSSDNSIHTWLNPSFQAFFGSRFCESNGEYSKDKKAYINALMAVEHHNTQAKTDYCAVGEIVREHLHRKGIHKVAVCGTGEKAETIIKILHAAKITILFYVNPAEEDNVPLTKKEQLKHRFSYLLHLLQQKNRNKVIQLTRLDYWPSVDAVIVSDHADFFKIREQFSKQQRFMLSCLDLVD